MTNSSTNSSYPQLALRPVGQKIPNIYRERIAQFTAPGQYEEHNLLGMINEATASGEPHVKVSVYDVPDLSRPKFAVATSQEFRPTKVGESFGPSWSTHWFKLQLTVPVDMCAKELLELHWDANNEGLVWTEDGKPLQGLTGGAERVEWILPPSFRDGKEHTIYIEMACNGMFGCAPGKDPIVAPAPDKFYQLTKAEIVAVNVQARQLAVDMLIIGDAACQFPDDSWEQHKLLVTANRIIETFQVADQNSILECRKIARECLGPKVDSAKVYSSNTETLVYGTGHCHIDSCWLWPWAETRRKVARSWSNQCNLMEQFPELRFTCSQAQQYKWLQQDYPYVFARVKEKVKQGSFQPIGGSWVEHDTNMPSGESLVRQFLYGQRFFQSHFGERCKTFWLPDTFGYSAQLPQLCRLAGMSRFLTHKLSWNNINKFPHTTFNWVALDGSQVICHMPPSETYTSDASLADVRRSVTQHRSMDEDPTSILIFGKGDGGGGPTWQHLEKLRRLRGLSDQVGMLPRVHMGHSVDDFFDRLEKRMENGLELVTWFGELYFELHRGTYTTQAKNKRNNRQCEFLLRDLELLTTVASLEDSNYKYPKQQLDDMWEGVMLCQFHDCLPGTSIEMCYDDSDEVYAMVFSKGKKILDDVYRVLGLSELSATSTGSVVALNTLPWDRREVIDLPSGAFGATSGTGVVTEVSPFTAVSDASVSIIQVEEDTFVMENSQLQVQIRNGVITSLYDRRSNREAIANGGKGNQFVIFDDKPLYWQAWDVEVFHLNSRKVLSNHSTRITENSAHRVSLMTETQISSNSWIKTTVSLSAVIEDSPTAVVVQSEIEWQETMKFLKVEFPVNVRNTEASFETQYGIVRRPTHYNTSWDMAKFEVCCHKFADLSENGYGISILNDSKYGFATCGNMMRLSLLRAPKAPDAHADMGRHNIRWAIFPHDGVLSSSTVRAAFEFNNPLRLVRAARGFDFPVKLTGDASIVLDVVKRGEDDEDVSTGELPKRNGRSVIVRVYESLGGTSRGILETKLDVKKVYCTNLLEDDGDEVQIKDGKVAIELRPFEVATWRLQL
ncbi:Alpha-mannosidase [Penicillium lagena]|uniref:Alpha-mannosidase n=1 Tax=Penicillium lagena TaxID=94218 RepID=UPI00253F7BB1|nr:Alpha-mannosidase [Penicillium lagena]KAJ5625617.1 Alpha-mannosidase [Penicillium lagena]